MAFGPTMCFSVGKLEIRLAPLKHRDMQLFIRNGGMQNFEVTKYLGRATAPVLEDEHEWFEKTRGDKNSRVWGIYVVEGKSSTLIGNTSLNSINREMMSHATSGFMIFRPEYWGKGIASACHKARTWYACTQLGLVQLRSGVYEPNTASQKALEKVGYVPVFHERNEGFVDGQYVGLTSLSLINPIDELWNHWWHGDPIPQEYRAARKKTEAALKWAQEHISFG